MDNHYKNHLVSIIIPSYNNSEYIVETLTSVLHQSYIHWECIIVDDGSTDNTELLLNEWCLRYSKFHYLNRPKSKFKGANTCRNIGLELSKGIFVMFLDADDILSENCLQNRINEFIIDSSLDFVIANTSFYSDGVFLNEPICKYPVDYEAEKYLELFLRYELPWTIMSVLWRRESIANAVFDETLSRLQDVDFHIQVLLKNELKCIRLNEIDTFYRTNSRSKGSNEYRLKVVNASKLFFEKYLTKSYLNVFQKKQFRRFVMLFLFKYVYPSQKELKVEVKQIDTIVKNSKLFSFKELFLLKIYKFIIKCNLHTKTGVGIYKLTKLLKKGLSYDR